MTRPKLTKRQEEVIRQLCSAHGRRLLLGKGGYYGIVEANGMGVPGTRGVAGIVVTALERADMLTNSRGAASHGLEPSADAWAAFGPGSRR